MRKEFSLICSVQGNGNEALQKSHEIKILFKNLSFQNIQLNSFLHRTPASLLKIMNSPGTSRFEFQALSLKLIKSTNLCMDNHRGSNMYILKKELEDLENETYLRIGKLNEIGTNKKETKKNSVSCSC